MPIYEYQCHGCHRQFQRLIMGKEDEKNLFCPNCGGRSLKKLISRVSYHLAESDRLEAFDTGSRQSDSFYKDTRNIGLAAKKRAMELGVDLGASFDEKVEKLRTDPGSVIKNSE